MNSVISVLLLPWFVVVVMVLLLLVGCGLR